jgi:hypothetical protein
VSHAIWTEFRADSWAEQVLELAADLAPGVWVAALGTLLLVVLARWYEPVPKRVAALFALAVVLLYGEALLGGSVLLPLDNLRGHVPFRELAPTDPHGNGLQGDLLYLVHPVRREVHRAAAEGTWPLLSPRIGGGSPLLADPQAQVLQPLAALGEGPLPAIRGPAGGPAGVVALRTLVALIFTFLLLRRLGAGRGPAAAGSMAFGLGGFLQLWVGWPLANTAALLPAVLYGLVLTDERSNEIDEIGAPLRRDLALLVFALAALLVAGHPETVFYALLVTGLFAGARLLRRRRGRRLAWGGRVAAALLLAAALVAPALLAFGEMLPHTLRWARLADPGPEVSAPEPDVDGDRRPATRLVQTAAPNALGNSRFVHYWGLRNTNEDAAGFVGTATLLAALLAFPGWLAGRRRPLGRPLSQELLGLGMAAGAATLMALPTGFAGLVPETGAPGRLALVLDLGLVLAAVGTLERFRRGSLPGWLRWAGPPAAALALAALHLWAYRSFPLPGAPETLDVLRWGWVHWHLRFTVLAAVTLVAGAGRRWTGPAIALLITAELVLAHRPANPPMPERLAFPETPVVAHLEPAVAGAGGRERMVGVGRAFLPNLPAVYGLYDARVFSPMASAAYARLLLPATERWSSEIQELDGVDHPGLYDRLAVRWIVTAPETGCPPGTAVELEAADGLVCRRNGAPAMATIGGAIPPVLRTSTAGDRWQLDGLAGQTGPRSASPRLETGLARVPGWRVLADGHPVPVAGEALIEADLPPETDRVDLLYRPGGFVAGLLLAAFGVAGFLAWLVPPPR